MGSHSRTGSAVFEYLHQIGYTPTQLWMVGVGVSGDEAIQFKDNWPEADVFGFEPNPVSFSGLRSNFPGTLIPGAVTDAPGVSDLHFHHSWKNGSSLHRPIESSSRLQSVSVSTFRLDQYTPKPGSFLWIDAEGSELKVLHGAVGFIDNVQAVNIEMTGRPRGTGWAKPEDIDEWLVTHGFYQAYVHSIRTVRGQFDAIYLRKEIFVPEMCSCLNSIRQWKLDTLVWG